MYKCHINMYRHQFLLVDISKSPHLVDVLFFMTLHMLENQLATTQDHLWPKNHGQ